MLTPDETETSDTMDSQAQWQHTVGLSLATLVGGCLVLFHAVNLFGFIVLRPWINLVIEFAISLLLAGFLLFVSLREVVRWFLAGTKYAEIERRVTRKSLSLPLTAMFFSLVALGFAFHASGSYSFDREGLPLLFVTIPLGCVLFFVSIRGIKNWRDQ